MSPREARQPHSVESELRRLRRRRLCLGPLVDEAVPSRRDGQKTKSPAEIVPSLSIAADNLGSSPAEVSGE